MQQILFIANPPFKASATYQPVHGIQIAMAVSTLGCRRKPSGVKVTAHFITEVNKLILRKKK